jgi:nitroreductase
MMYGLLDIPREDKASRIKQFIANYRFFDAPVAMFFSMDRQMCEGQWSDLGMFIQSIMLLAREYDLHTCPQECWAAFTPTVRPLLQIPEDHIFFCGMAVGYMNEADLINKLRTERADESEFATFIGFDQ